MNETKATFTHKFELAGLGLAPFRCVGFSEKKMVVGIGQDATVRPGSSCDYCGNAIMNVFHILSADGKRFKVGCDCVAKTGDEGLKRNLRTHPDVLKHKRVLEANKATAIFETLKGLIERNREKFAGMPHPRGFTDRKTGAPLTYLDQVQWLFDHSGRAGRKSLLSSLLRQGF